MLPLKQAVVQALLAGRRHEADAAASAQEHGALGRSPQLPRGTAIEEYGGGPASGRQARDARGASR